MPCAWTPTIGVAKPGEKRIEPIYCNVFWSGLDMDIVVARPILIAQTGAKDTGDDVIVTTHNEPSAFVRASGFEGSGPRVGVVQPLPIRMQIAPKRQHRFGEVRFEWYDVVHELN